MTTATEVDTLRETVARYRVCWDVWPEFALVKGKRMQIGFELELSGTHEPGVEHPSPGCEHCQRVFLGLVEIADWIQPKERRLSRYEIEPYQQTLRYSQRRNSRPDVSLSLRILHREDGLQPVDPCEERCLDEMEHRLGEIGACKGSWRGEKGDWQ